MKEYYLNSQDSFIMGWYIDPTVCDKLIELYNHPNTILNSGLSTNAEVHTNIKDSTDCTITNFKCIEFYLNHLKQILDLYSDRYENSVGSCGYTIKESINIQHYKVGGGFKVWHSERMSADVNIRDRHLVFMTYLNDVDDGGTEFFHQKLKPKAEKGLTLIWPADWTHTHRGEISYTKEKYIITGWISYNASNLDVDL